MAKHRDTAVAMTEDLFDIHDIQGNILAGFNKDHQLLMAFRLRDLVAARAWLKKVVVHINSMSEVGNFNALFRERRARLAGKDPTGLVATWANIAFSYPGLVALTSQEEANAVPDTSFQAGMPARAAFLGDRAPDGKGDVTREWRIGGTGNVPDVLLIVASDDETQLSRLAKQLLPDAADAGAPQLVWQEMGGTRPDLPGHEHFGFRDGVSQPAVRGLISTHPQRFLSPRMLEPGRSGDVEFAAPGNPLIWPGQFVFGYPATSKDNGGPLPPAEDTPMWIKNGSLLVFRRLRQNVEGFHSFLQKEAVRLSKSAEFSGMKRARLGAMLVGRWASGAPVSRAPDADVPALGDNTTLANDFLFNTDTPAPLYLPHREIPDPFTRATADPLGVVCPRAAHIRKVNPRDAVTDVGDQFDTLRRRVLRRGIPYGAPFPIPADGPVPADDHVDRGLHFLCYQTSIIDQFEFLQTDWANSLRKPQPLGADMVIGQTPDARNSIELITKEGDSATVAAPRQFVAATGGGYFFAPSLSALNDLATRK